MLGAVQPKMHGGVRMLDDIIKGRIEI